MNDAAGMQPAEACLADPMAPFADNREGIGYVGPDIPIDVLLATHRPFGHLPWQTDDLTPWADRWLESSFPFWARSILEQWHQGVFDTLDTVVFSRADDASQRLYYYVAELRRRGKLAGPEPAIFDISFIPRPSGLTHTEAAVAELMKRLEAGPESLAHGIARANRLRKQIAVIEDMRAADGPACERLFRAALWNDPTGWIEDIALPTAAHGRRRVLLTGSMPPDDRLHQIVETADASIVAEVHALSAGRPGPEISIDAEPAARTIARQLRESSVAPRACYDRAANVVELAQAVAADAVLIWLTREDEGLAWTLPAQTRALTAAGVAVLALPTARWQADGDTADLIHAFLRGAAP